jgi:hypothetical protein
VLLALLPVAASAQNLVANGGFSSALVDWRTTGNGTASLSLDDIDGDPVSGSALLRNAEVDAGVQAIPLDQCVALPGPGVYLVGASSRLDATQVAGRAVLGTVLYGGANCTGSIRGGAGRGFPRASTWTPVSFLVSVDISVSMLVRLGVEKAVAGGTIEVQVDDVFVGLTPQLFRNGFE